ncbi:MAG: sorbosone dehydrogenase family protein, partial [Novosphingobium sp.]|nr:sorbosone dehydrogenase family protein [Novosphingobium sp.]
MTTKRKLLVALAVFLVVFGILAAWIWRGTPAEHSLDELSGRDPVISKPKPEEIPSVAIARPIGWAPGEAPKAAQGLEVARYAEGLEHPRVIYVLPNGDVLVAEADAPGGSMGGGLTAKIGETLMKRAGSHGTSPDKLILLRDANGDGKAEVRETLLEGDLLASPSGLAWNDDTLYVANHDAVLAFTYKLGETRLTGEPRKVMDLPGAGNHWMRNIVLSPDGHRLYAAVGSASNIGEKGMELEKGRAAIWEKDLYKDGYPRQYAQGLRNPNGMGW